MEPNSTTSSPPAFCAACGAPLSPGARFCHRCGTSAGSAGSPATSGAAAPVASILPWGVAAIALVALIALLAGQYFGRRPTAAPVATQAPAAAPFAGGNAGPAPDISTMSPQERADRLFDRVMTYSDRGLADSATFFSPMALGAFEAISPRTIHHRYDMGLIGLVTGDGALAAAQADTILREAPTHLLGLALAARAADAMRDTGRRNDFERRLLAAEAAERAKRLPEYTDHETDLRTAIEAARRPRTP